MDDLNGVIEKFSSALETTTINNASRANLFKNVGRLGNQAERRRELLDRQKNSRNQHVDNFRGIFEEINSPDSMEWSTDFSYHKSHYRPSVYVAGFNRAPTNYSKILMFSEWIIEKPDDFEQNWYIVPCPKAIRCLLIACKGSTCIYNKFGRFKHSCCTALPGGSPFTKKYMTRCCILDGFYQEKNNTFYILDILGWNQQPMADGETEFRQYWMESNLVDYPDIREISKKNEIIIDILPKISCDRASLNNYLMEYPAFKGDFPELDGFLFYHKKACYYSGETPLVGWLFPYMITEILGSDITIHESYLSTKPIDYVNQKEFIEQFEARLEKRNKILYPNRNSDMMSETTQTAETIADDILDEEGNAGPNDAMEVELNKVKKSNRKNKKDRKDKKREGETLME